MMRTVLSQWQIGKYTALELNEDIPLKNIVNTELKVRNMSPSLFMIFQSILQLKEKGNLLEIQ